MVKITNCLSVVTQMSDQNNYGKKKTNKNRFKNSITSYVVFFLLSLYLHLVTGAYFVCFDYFESHLWICHCISNETQLRQQPIQSECVDHSNKSHNFACNLNAMSFSCCLKLSAVWDFLFCSFNELYTRMTWTFLRWQVCFPRPYL